MLALIILPFSSFAVTNDLSGALQRGLFEEEANRNLDAAVQAYQAVSAQFDKDRKLAATAIFRLGEVYRKQGKTNEAIAQYERIVREFPDEQTLATLSRQNLAGLEPQARRFSDRIAAVVTRDGASASGAALSSAVAAAEAEIQSLTATLEKFTNLPPNDLRAAVQQSFPNPVLTDLLKQLTQVEQKLAMLKQDLTPEHPDAVKASTLVQTIKKQIEDQVFGTIKGLQIKLDAAKDTANKLRAQLDTSRSAQAKPTSSRDAVQVTTNDEEKEIHRLQEMIKNSPDLMNAPGEDKLTPLCRAAGKGQLRVARFLLDCGAAIDRRSGDRTPLHFAASGGHRAMTDLLLDRGADVNARDGNGRTPLHIAAENGYQAVAEGLVVHKADVNAITRKQETPLHLAAGKGHAELVKYLISKGAELDAKDENGHTAVSLAAGRGHSESVTALLDAKANPNLEDNKGRTPLSYAAEAGHLVSVNALLAAKGDPNAGRLSPPLHAAIHRKSPAIVEALLRAGAGPNAVAAISWTFGAGAPPFAQTTYGIGWQYANLTPLFIAIKEANSAESVKLLLQYKADPNGVSPEGCPLIFSAVGQPEILKLLLEAGAKPNVEMKGSPGWTPLWAANSAESTKLLLAHGANTEVWIQDRTPLLRAVEEWGKDKVEALLQGGANVNARDNHDLTPLHVAVIFRSAEIVSLLLAHKADVNARDEDGQTPLDLAKTIKQNANIAELLRQHGGLCDLPKVDRIEVRRGDASTTVFLKGTNDWNHFTLLDALYGQYGASEPLLAPSIPAPASFSQRIANLKARLGTDMPFPDLHRIVVVRSSATPAKPPRRINVDLLLPTGAVDCSKDIPLEFGDVVEIPEREHTLQEPAVGLTNEELQQIANCRVGTVGLLVRGKRTELTVWPRTADASIGHVLMRQEVRSKLFSSSDLSRLKVTRRDPGSGKLHEWIVDCSGGKFPDLWLRDGDVIEVPDKP